MLSTKAPTGHSTIVALSGGVGGAKLTLGLYRQLAPDSLTVVVNTGDDFEHLGLRICPDLDTTLYTLANLEHPAQGWGRRDETWTLMRVIESLGEDPWFKLGDADTALHVVRTQRMRAGSPLSVVIDAFRRRLGITARLLPMTDDRVETRVATDEGELAFQDYFVRRRCQPRVRAIHFAGAANATPGPGVCEALAADSLAAIILCPSNPYLSMDPLLAIPVLRAALEGRRAPAIAVSPLIGGAAVKGPTGKIMQELGIAATSASIAMHYSGLIDALVIDTADAASAAKVTAACGIPVFATATLMTTLEDRVRLARFVLDRADELRSDRIRI